MENQLRKNKYSFRNEVYVFCAKSTREVFIKKCVIYGLRYKGDCWEYFLIDSANVEFWASEPDVFASVDEAIDMIRGRVV